MYKAHFKAFVMKFSYVEGVVRMIAYTCPHSNHNTDRKKLVLYRRLLLDFGQKIRDYNILLFLQQK